MVLGLKSDIFDRDASDVAPGAILYANEATGVTYAFYVNANTNGNIGTVPSGTYTIYICPFNNYDPSNNYSVGYNYITGVVCASFYSISIVSQTEVRIY